MRQGTTTVSGLVIGPHPFASGISHVSVASSEQIVIEYVPLGRSSVYVVGLGGTTTLPVP